ncbi:MULTISPECIES: MucR family transcriptional regulator [unclassified Sphingomonas]|uniref:MucR family transcriptional regulator n=1 Tax=unclassified Sphingomonas TaxID=196159 RepID=UPI002269C1C1|nr:MULTISPECIES: MucR family transcriptional regulator [unclassified Sphingomonas]
MVMLAADLTSAWLSNANNRVNADDVPAFLAKMHATVQQLSGQNQPVADEPAPQEYTAAVSVRKSLASPDHIISMIDGKSYKTLKRHLSTNGLTPAEYRERYGLKADYPMVAPTYGEARRQMAKKIGLGRKPKADAPDAAPAKPPRKPKTPETAE